MCRTTTYAGPAPLRRVQVLLCLTLMLVVNLITCFISSLTGIKLKRMNHRARMLEVSKRVSAELSRAVASCLLHAAVQDGAPGRAWGPGWCRHCVRPPGSVTLTGACCNTAVT